MSAAAWTTALDRLYPRDRINAAARDRRETALAAFESQGFPTRRIEEWHYTDLGAIAQAGFEPAATAPGTSAKNAAAALAGLPYGPEAALAVFVDGAYAPALSRLPDNLGASLVASDGDDGEFVVPEPRHALTALNAAFAVKHTLTITPALDAGTPLVLVFIGATPRTTAQLHLDIRAMPASHASLYLHCVSTAGDAPGWTNFVMDIDQAAESRLKLIRVQQYSPERALTALLRAQLAANASLTIGSFDTGGSLVRTDIEAALSGPGATIDLFGLATAAKGQHVDNHLYADHRSPDTRSTQTFRSIVDDGGRVVFNGKVVVRPDAQRIDARQSSDNLLLARGAEVDTKPELEIYADDVRCSHGATVGELDEGELFYLRSRGIDTDSARRLLTFAFANRILERIDAPDIRRAVTERIAGRLDDALPPMDAGTTAPEIGS